MIYWIFWNQLLNFKKALVHRNKNIHAETKNEMSFPPARSIRCKSHKLILSSIVKIYRRPQPWRPAHYQLGSPRASVNYSHFAALWSQPGITSKKLGLIYHFWCSLLCLVLLQFPKCFVLVQIFCARPKDYLHIVAVTNTLCQTERWFAFSKIGFCVGTKVFEEALSAVKFLGWLKKFGAAQNIMGPVKGQGIRTLN